MRAGRGHAITHDQFGSSAQVKIGGGIGAMGFVTEEVLKGVQDAGIKKLLVNSKKDWQSCQDLPDFENLAGLFYQQFL